MTATINPRELKGKVIATAKRSIKRYNESGNGKYKVILTKIG
jgi:hypothetical protein